MLVYFGFAQLTHWRLRTPLPRTWVFITAAHKQLVWSWACRAGFFRAHLSDLTHISITQARLASLAHTTKPTTVSLTPTLLNFTLPPLPSVKGRLPNKAFRLF